MSIEDFNKLYSKSNILDEVAATKEEFEKKVLIDVKGILDKNSINNKEFVYWRL